MSNFIFQALNGISSAMFLWLIAAGLTVAFGVCGILNVAHGSLYMVGAYFAFTFFQMLGINFWLSIILALIGVGIIGFLMERFFFRRIYNQPIEFQLILTFAFILIFDNLTKIVWGTMLIIPNMPHFFQGAVSVVGRPFPIYNLFIIFAGIAVGVFLWAILNKTWWGKKLKAAASDRDMANAIGINIPILFTMAFIFAALLAALGGALSTPIRVCDSGVGGAVIIPAFVVTVIGGLGSLRGAFVGALIIGVVSSICTLYLPFIELFVLYLIMAVVLIIRPQGIFGEKR
ncbi:MAG: branched-chain amino acid ABC transporter permease [Deltaproteobacteria bacterium]|nr:branched-chain amino acid ABC transporter permease [Deltaproteobacteria bacterium]MBW1930332.1 branched-chain amino acid ABC transporter permease [Deltaproteobacteria bacterium]MBW2025891.1 branched-chain amino acid ABC transporter permease [Deltaproteobacteria bacterium]MBW2125262.1 branched-chain amino acid ABC transporter permease [Deltaproteobacteria bacterium]